ncbi:MAG TPA: phosphoglucosamine mutase [Gaiellaceae bacterium]|nr:phosphoglucosamine mutase [Gaiellaceae bacterium]
MPRRYFGTDGVRGVVGEDLTEALVERLGRAFAGWNGGSPVLVGRDTRASGPALERALARGLAAGGSRVALGGVLPTPAVALLAGGSGAVVSASHNPAEYNGVKFFRDGWKLDDADEEAIEALLDAVREETGPELPAAPEPGLAERYVELVCESFGADLGGVRLAVDCANGAMAAVAPRALARLGAELVTVGVTPDGSNINAGCGATDLRLLAETVRSGRFDLGVAFDGDGDRMLAVDAEGNEVDGDGILAVLALHLGVDLVAVTQMTNLGFHRLMAERGIRVVTTEVGDRYVLEALRAEGGLLGGEQSGHVIWLDGHTTGDGLVAAVLLARAVAEEGRPLARLAAVLSRLPQAKADVRVARKELPRGLLEEIAGVGEELGERGRVLVRPSGTEPVVRVLAEAETAKDAERLCGRIATLVRRELG